MKILPVSLLVFPAMALLSNCTAVDGNAKPKTTVTRVANKEITTLRYPDGIVQTQVRDAPSSN